MAAMENDFENTTISLYGTVPDSIVDGPGLRYAVFVQGCSHHCPGCHNPESQPAEGGTETTLAALLADIRANGLVHDVTLSGGEPFEQPEALRNSGGRAEAQGYGIWCLQRLPLRRPCGADGSCHRQLGTRPYRRARRWPLRGIAQVPRAEVVRLLQPAPDRPTSHTTCRLRRGMATRLVFAGETF